MNTCVEESIMLDKQRLGISKMYQTWISSQLYSLLYDEFCFCCASNTTSYTIYRKDRSTRGGGVLLPLRHNSPSQLLSSPDNLELLLVKVNSSISFRLCMIYHPPNADNTYSQDLITYLETIAAEASPLIIIGDFNSPRVDWHTLSGHTYFSNQLYDLIFQFNMTQLVTSSTHTEGNLLDLVITDSPNLINLLTIHSHKSIPITSDHYLISFTVQHCSVKQKKSPATCIHNFIRCDYHGMCDYLSSCDLSSFYVTADIKEAWSILKYHINRAIDLYVPKIKLHSSQHPKWFNSHIRHHINCLRTLLGKTKNHFSGSNLNKPIQAEDYLP